MLTNLFNVTKLDVSSFDTSSVVDMSVMFAHNISLIELDVSNFDTSNVTNMRGMFHRALSIERLDLRSFNTMNVVNKDQMFQDTQKLTQVLVTQSTWRTVGVITAGMWSGSNINTVTFG